MQLVVAVGGPWAKYVSSNFSTTYRHWHRRPDSQFLRVIDEKAVHQWRSLARINQNRRQQKDLGRRPTVMASLDGAAECGSDRPEAEHGCEADWPGTRCRHRGPAPLNVHRPTRLKEYVCVATMLRMLVAVCVSREMLRCGFERAGFAGPRVGR